MRRRDKSDRWSKSGARSVEEGQFIENSFTYSENMTEIKSSKQSVRKRTYAQRERQSLKDR